MKIISIADIHGKTCWKDIVNQNSDTDLFIFLGDYFDNYNESSAIEQINNFKDIVEFKKTNTNKVVLLTGNHDIHYHKSITERYSGYQKLHALDIQEALHQALDADLMQMCYIHNNILFSHAGLTKTWCNKHLIQMEDLAMSVNNLFKYKPNSFIFTMGKNLDFSGDDICQPPGWVRPNSLYIDRIDGYLQVVGHTQQGSIDTANHIIFIDTLGTSGEYLQIIDDNLTAKKLSK